MLLGTENKARMFRIFSQMVGVRVSDGPGLAGDLRPLGPTAQAALSTQDGWSRHASHGLDSEYLKAGMSHGMSSLARYRCLETPAERRLAEWQVLALRGPFRYACSRRSNWLG